MLRAIVLAALAGGLIAVPGAAAEPLNTGKPGPGVEKMLATLHGARITYEKNLNETPLFELLQDMAKRFDVTFIVMEERFISAGETNIRDRKPSFAATRIEGLTLSRFLSLVLNDLDAVYLVRADYIEIVPRSTAWKEVGLTEQAAEGRTNLQIVSLAVTDAPLAEVFGDLSRNYGLNVVISPAAREAMKAVKVTEQLLNVPAETALELLAGQAGLTVTRKANTFRITAEGK